MKIENLSNVFTSDIEGKLTEITTVQEFTDENNEKYWYQEQIFINNTGKVVGKFEQCSESEYATGNASQLSNKREDIFVVNKEFNDVGIATKKAIVQVLNDEHKILNVYDEIGCCVDTDINDYFKVKKDGLYGFIDINGTEFITPQYKSAEFFYDEVAIVNKNGFIGAINKQNETVIPFNYINSDNSHFVGGYCAFKLPNSEGLRKWHLINNKGEIVFKHHGEIINLGFGNFLITKDYGKSYEMLKLDN